MATDALTKQTVGDLLDEHDFDLDDDPFEERPAKTTNAERDDKAVLSPRKRKADDTDLNVDDEIKITKKARRQIVKLDTERLLSEPGLPRVRTLIRSGQIKKRLRLKGKGHEFSDVARLLNYYQLWLDNLYPRAKFADALQLVEKAGHNKRLQIMRKEWIDQSKPSYREAYGLDETEKVEERPQVGTDSHDMDVPEDTDAMFFSSGEKEPATENEIPEDDELEALMAANAAQSRSTTQRQAADESEGEDDLDALLALEKPRLLAKSTTIEPADEEDDLEALLHEEANLSRHKSSPPIPADEDREDDEDDLDALLATGSEPELPPPPATKIQLVQDKTPGSEEVPELDNAISSSPIPNVATDDLDQLIDEHDDSLRKGAEEELGHFISSSPIPNGDSQ